MSSKLVLVPSGGLANRMKAIAAGLRLAKINDVNLRIIWHKGWGMGCGFYEVFKPIVASNVSIEEGTWLQHYTLDRPRRHNFHLPYIFERLQFSRIMYEAEAAERMRAHFDFAAWSKGHDTFLNSYSYFLSMDIPSDAFDCFVPTDAVMAKADPYISQFCGHRVIGVHIRRTDHVTAIRQSPTELFVERMQQEPKDTIFYLATDSEEVKAQLKGIFDGRILFSPHPASRDSVDGIQDGLAEMLILSKTCRILGSAGSTFSEAAATMGHIECEIIKRPY